MEQSATTSCNGAEGVKRSQSEDSSAFFMEHILSMFACRLDYLVAASTGIEVYEPVTEYL
jgi:hypothetical protein